MTFIFSGLSLKSEILPYHYLNLSNEALASAKYKSVIQISENFLNENINSNACTSEILASHLYNLKNAYNALGLPDKYREFSLNLFNKIDQERAPTLLRSFFILALDSKGDYFQNSPLIFSFSLFGDNTEGLEFFDENLSKLPADFISSRPLLEAWLPIIRADLLAYNQDFENAEKEIENSEKIIQENFTSSSPEYLIPSLAKEVLFAAEGKWEEALKQGIKNKESLENLNKATRELYALEGRLQYYYQQLGQYAKSIEAGKKALIKPSTWNNLPYAISYRSFQGPSLHNSPSSVFSELDHNRVYEMLALAAFKTGQYNDGVNYASRLLYNLEKDIASQYSKFAFNKADPLLKQKVDLLVNVSPVMAINAPADSLLQTLAYDASLVYKQLSLSAGNLYRNIISKIGNQAISTHYENLENSRKLLETVSSEKMDSLLESIEHLEATLQRHLNARTKVSMSELPRWKDVKDALQPGEIALEFFIASDEGENRYVASLLTPDSNFPQIFDLCSVEEIDQIPDILEGNKTYDLLFAPLKDKIEHASTLYFSPIGKLNLVPLEYIKTDDDIRFNEKIDLVRLSSTRELAFRNENFHPEDIILYGGVKFNLDNEENLTSNINSDNQSDNYYNFDTSDETGNKLRAGLAYLPGTLEEIKEIEKIFTSTGYKADLIEGSQATESSVKALDNKKIPVVHIATHGFSVPDNSRSKLGRLLSSKSLRSTFEEKSLSTSGLMMAGASNTLAGSKPDNSFDDGILTGSEIARINLSNVNMVVLSACESGLGEVGSEGVMGLQRGLKKAGVQSLLMSLWKVDDKATSLLMTEFYRNLVKGENATRALKSAQQYLRKMDNGKYDDPLYWGAFILLDAI
ncbi:MAG: CHAT domain-containing protein [Muribaculaceae bacterium]|nr:CHAT domain-containing protein [Muribaculaceae bacterium]